MKCRRCGKVYTEDDEVQAQLEFIHNGKLFTCSDCTSYPRDSVEEKMLLIAHMHKKKGFQHEIQKSMSGLPRSRDQMPCNMH